MAISGDQGRGSQGLVTELCGTEEVELPGAYTANGTSWGAGQMLPNHPPSLGSLTEGLRLGSGAAKQAGRSAREARGQARFVEPAASPSICSAALTTLCEEGLCLVPSPSTTGDAFCSSLRELLSSHASTVAANDSACALPGDPGASLLDMEPLLAHEQGLHGLLTGPGSNESSCNTSADVPSTPAALFDPQSASSCRSPPSAAAGLQDPLRALGPLQLAFVPSAEMPCAGGAELCEFLTAACSGFLTDDAGSQECSGQTHPPSACSSLGRSDSDASSAHMLASMLGGLRAPSARAAVPGCNVGLDGRRKRGRPRRYDTTLPLVPGLMEAMAAPAGQVNGLPDDQRKRMRGAKPKYKFLTAEEAVAHRRERNRTTALASYQKRKARETALKAEMAVLGREQEALQQLLQHVQHVPLERGRLHRLLEAAGGSAARVLNALRQEQR